MGHPRLPEEPVPTAGPSRHIGRPPLTAEQVQARIDAYCTRYGVKATPSGLPPFPSGQRETPQHRDWLTVYRAHQRLERRRPHDSAPPPAARPSDSRGPSSGGRRSRCPLCELRLEPDEAVRFGPPGRRSGPLLHEPCLELVRHAERVGPEGLARLAAILSGALR